MLRAALNTNLLTPQMAGVLDRIHRAKRPPFHSMSAAAARAAYDALQHIPKLVRG